MPSNCLASVDLIEFHTIEAYSGLGLTGVKYKIHMLSRVEKEYIIFCSKPSILTDWEKQ
jgi:hypothetical protein